MLSSLLFVGTLNMAILCLKDVEHPKIPQFSPGIKNQISKNQETDNRSIGYFYRQKIGFSNDFPLSFPLSPYAIFFICL